MNNKTLYIIGNGFDMYHGLDTSYKTFSYFLKENHSDIYELFIQYYGLPDLNPKEHDRDKELLWSKFENALADLDFQTVLDDNTDYLANPSNTDFRDRDWHAYEIEMEMFVDKLTKDLWNVFREFILAVEFPESVDNKLLWLKGNSVFLNFNYTDTLEKYYFIKNQRILYIHGKAKIIDDKIILGHGRNPTTFEEKEKTPPEGLSEEQLEMWREQMADNYDYSYESGKSVLMSYFSDSFKSTDEIIQNHEQFFDSLKDVKQVYVLGHSLAEVDHPYFKKVIQSVTDKNIIWTVTYYFDTDINYHNENLTTLGLYKKQIALVKMETLKLTQPTLF